MTRIGALALFLLSVALGGCNCGGNNNPDGGQGDSGTPEVDAGGPSVALSEFCSEASKGFRNQTYEEAVYCGQPLTVSDLDHLFYYPGFVTYTDYLAFSSCNDAGLGDQWARYESAITAGRLRYDAEKAFACRKLGRESDGGLKLRDAQGNPIEPCNSIFEGLVPQNGACEATYECAGDNYCKPTNDSSCSGTCVPRLAVSTQCSPVRDTCTIDGRCAGNDAGVYTCVARLGLNEPCDSSSECLSNLQCFTVDSTTGETRCVARARLNEACIINDDDEDSCAEGHCVTASGATAGTCQAYAGQGKPCGTARDGQPLCEYCYTCEAGACAVFGRTGATCTTDDDCFDPQLWYCNSGSCAVRPRLGEACLGSEDHGAPGNCMYYDNWCRKSSDGGEGTPGSCVGYPGLGGRCGLEFDVTSYCLEGFCKGDAGVCSPLAALGDLCTVDDSLFGISPGCATDDAFCDTRPDAGGPGGDLGVCRLAAAPTEPCSLDIPCRSGSFCDPPSERDGGPPNRACRALLADGQSCTTNSQCQSGLCDPPAASDGGPPNRACAALRSLGASCDRNAHCQSGTCDPATKRCTSQCGVIANPIGCMDYSLKELSLYLLFALVLLPALRRKR